ncbi:MAG: VOC family protein [Elusimicrobia bacterium]|nr:VOC family protein [Elusimicrobiota bacterium]
MKKLFSVLGISISLPEYVRELDAEIVEVECGPASLYLWRPCGGDSPMARWIKRRGRPGLHHVMFDVEDLPSAVDSLKRRGVRFLGGTKELPRRRQAFIDPDQAHGALIELAESWDRTGPRRSRPGEPKLDHLSWAVRDMEGARSFFALLGSEVTAASEDTPVFGCNHAGVRTAPSISIKAPSGDGPFARYIAKHGPGLHHIMFEVADLRSIGASIREAGFRLTPEEPIPEPHQTTWFVHPRGAQGILIELGEPVRKPVPNVAIRREAAASGTPS